MRYVRNCSVILRIFEPLWRTAATYRALRKDIMIKIHLLACGVPAALIASCAPSAPAGVPGPIPELAGRTAGPPQTCVRIEPNASMRITDSHNLIYSEGSTVWLNTNSCPAVSFNDLLVLHPTASEHCRGDIVNTVDRYSGIPGPSCVMGDFVPYRRPPR
jgi:hypothetical protein